MADEAVDLKHVLNSVKATVLIENGDP